MVHHLKRGRITGVYQRGPSDGMEKEQFCSDFRTGICLTFFIEKLEGPRLVAGPCDRLAERREFASLVGELASLHPAINRKMAARQQEVT